MAEAVQETPSKQLNSSKSSDFRYIPTDAIRIGVSDHGVKLIFAIDEDEGNILELIGVSMSIHTAKMLRDALIEGINHQEDFTKTRSELAAKAEHTE